jgi:hypothetical protein
LVGVIGHEGEKGNAPIGQIGVEIVEGSAEQIWNTIAIIGVHGVEKILG